VLVAEQARTDAIVPVRQGLPMPIFWGKNKEVILDVALCTSVAPGRGSSLQATVAKIALMEYG
jgi:hypothetical protein